jgi:transcriptional regulator with PAS, ATPase and Fis domain
LPENSTSEDLRRVFDALGFITDSDVMQPVLRQASRAALASDVTVLLEGETGCGKQVLAEAIHSLDIKRRSFPFITVHCGAINEALAESEFFGHTKGAFSGAISDRKGLFQSAHRGTLFLDDVNDLPLQLQAKLLDVLQRRVVRPVGGDAEKMVDVRIMAACNQPLKPLVRSNRFRSDLFHRLNVVCLVLAPLRLRTQDLRKLVLALALRHQALYKPIESVEPGLLRLLECQPFLGNIRELDNAVQRMLFSKAQGASLGLADWAAQTSANDVSVREGESGLLDQAADLVWNAISSEISLKFAIREVESKVLEKAAGAAVGTRKDIAASLGTSERTLYSKMRQLRLGNRSLLEG